VTADAVIAERTANWSESDRSVLAEVLAALRPSARHVADILDWLDDIAAREGVRPGAVLADAELQAIVRYRGSAPDRLKRWKERLRRIRYPRLVAREREIVDLVRAMDLGDKVSVTPPPALEGGELTIALRVRSSAELATLLDRVRGGIARGDLDRLFTLLDEA
jgi:hypothetical protein